jgi:hypothetical protein
MLYMAASINGGGKIRKNPGKNHQPKRRFDIVNIGST